MIGLDNRTGPTPSLVAPDILRVHAMRDAGMTAPEIARIVGVSTRTVWRYLASYLVTTLVEGHPLTFLIRPGKAPVIVRGSRRRS